MVRKSTRNLEACCARGLVAMVLLRLRQEKDEKLAGEGSWRGGWVESKKGEGERKELMGERDG